jgi:hypothetical protein
MTWRDWLRAAYEGPLRRGGLNHAIIAAPVTLGFVLAYPAAPWPLQAAPAVTAYVVKEIDAVGWALALRAPIDWFDAVADVLVPAVVAIGLAVWL